MMTDDIAVGDPQEPEEDFTICEDCGAELAHHVCPPRED